MSESVHAPALVHCSATVPVADKKDVVENFEIYQYLDVDPDGVRNIFGGDQPFLYVNDCVPYINIQPFPGCKSPYYGNAVFALLQYVRNETRKTQDPKRLLALGEEESRLSTAYTSYQDREGLIAKYRYYPCILQLLDRWFQDSTGQFVTNYFNQSQAVMNSLRDVITDFASVRNKARKQLEKSLPNFWERAWNAFTALELDIKEDIKINYNMNFDYSLQIEYGGFSRADAELNYKKDALERFDNQASAIYTKLMDLQQKLSDELFFSKNPVMVKSGLDQLMSQLTAFWESLKSFATDSKDYVATVSCLETSVVGLKNAIGRITDSETEFLNNDSRLICRCGGVIRIVFDSLELDQYIDKIYPNIVALLKEAEKDLANDFSGNKEEEKKNSLAGGFNMIRSTLRSIGESSSYTKYSFVKGDSSYSAAINIKVRPERHVKEENHRQDAAKTAVAQIPGVDVVVTIADVIQWLGDPDRTADGGINIVKDTVGFFGDLNSENLFKSLAGVWSNVSSAIDWTRIFADLLYTTNADYTGEIKIVVDMAWHQYTYIGRYDFYGNRTALSTDKQVFYEMGSSSDEASNIEYRKAIFRDTAKLEYTVIRGRTEIEGAMQIE